MREQEMRGEGDGWLRGQLGKKQQQQPGISSQASARTWNYQRGLRGASEAKTEPAACCQSGGQVPACQTPGHSGSHA